MVGRSLLYPSGAGLEEGTDSAQKLVHD